MKTLTIGSNSSKSKNNSKTRAFTVAALAGIEADNIWEGGQRVLGHWEAHSSSQPHRPVFLAVAGTDGELRPFSANVTMGRYAFARDTTAINRRYRDNDDKDPSQRYFLLKSAGFMSATQKNADGEGTSVVTHWIGDLFQLDPGLIDGSAVTFISALPQSKAAEMLSKLTPTDREQVLAYASRMGLMTEGANRLGLPVYFNEEELIEMLPLATYFAAFIEKRLYVPFPPELSFYLHLYLTTLQAGGASLLQTRLSLRHEGWEQFLDADKWIWARHHQFGGFTAWGLNEIGLLSPVAMNVQRADFTKFLAGQIKVYFGAGA